MGVLDKLARAETSSDLRHYEEPCDVDVLAAVGMAGAVAPIYIHLYRLKYLNDETEIWECKGLFIRWARSSMIRRGIEPSGASRVGVQALSAWVRDTCKGCAGQKYRQIEGTPALSLKVCTVCKGTGKNPIKDGPLGEVTKDVISRAELAISGINGRVKDKLK